MAIASKNKTRKGAGKARAKATGKPASKSKAPSTKAPNRKTAATKTPAAQGKARSSTANGGKVSPKKAAKKRIVEPERSAPAMAEVDADVLEFIAAIDDFKKQHGRPFPSWSEVLLIVRQLGYERS